MENLPNIVRTDPAIAAYVAQIRISDSEMLKKVVDEPPKKVVVCGTEYDPPVVSHLYDTPATLAVQGARKFATYEKKYGKGSFFDDCLDDWISSGDIVTEEDKFIKEGFPGLSQGKTAELDDIMGKECSSFNFNVRPREVKEADDVLLSVNKKGCYFALYDSMPKVFAVWDANFRDFGKVISYLKNSEKGQQAVLVCRKKVYKEIYDWWASTTSMPLGTYALGIRHPVYDLFIAPISSPLPPDAAVVLSENAEKVRDNKLKYWSDEAIRDLIAGRMCAMPYHTSDNGLPTSSLGAVERHNDTSNSVIETIFDNRNINYARRIRKLDVVFSNHVVTTLNPSDYEVMTETDYAKCTYTLYVATPRAHAQSTGKKMTGFAPTSEICSAADLSVCLATESVANVIFKPTWRCASYPKHCLFAVATVERENMTVRTYSGMAGYHLLMDNDDTFDGHYYALYDPLRFKTILIAKIGPNCENLSFLYCQQLAGSFARDRNLEFLNFFHSEEISYASLENCDVLAVNFYAPMKRIMSSTELREGSYTFKWDMHESMPLGIYRHLVNKRLNNLWVPVTRLRESGWACVDHKTFDVIDKEPIPTSRVQLKQYEERRVGWEEMRQRLLYKNPFAPCGDESIAIELSVVEENNVKAILSEKLIASYPAPLNITWTHQGIAFHLKDPSASKYLIPRILLARYLGFMATRKVAEDGAPQLMSDYAIDVLSNIHPRACFGEDLEKARVTRVRRVLASVYDSKMDREMRRGKIVGALRGEKEARAEELIADASYTKRKKYYEKKG